MVVYQKKNWKKNCRVRPDNRWDFQELCEQDMETLHTPLMQLTQLMPKEAERTEDERRFVEALEVAYEYVNEFWEARYGKK